MLTFEQVRAAIAVHCHEVFVTTGEDGRRVATNEYTVPYMFVTVKIHEQTPRPLFRIHDVSSGETIDEKIGVEVELVMRNSPARHFLCPGDSIEDLATLCNFIRLVKNQGAHCFFDSEGGPYHWTTGQMGCSIREQLLSKYRSGGWTTSFSLLDKNDIGRTINGDH